MITKNGVIHFYEKYKENLKKEEQVTAELMEAGNQEKWLEKLRQKFRIMRQLYIENEAMLNQYIRPFTKEQVELTEEIAKEFLNQIRKAWREGFEDSLCMMEMAECLLPYFKERGLLEDYIWDLSLLGIFYNGSSEKEEGRKAFIYFEKVKALSNHYFEIKDFEVRKRLIYSFYNCPIMIVNFLLADTDELNLQLDEAEAFFNHPQVRALDGDKFDFDGLLEELNYDVFGNYVMSHTRETADRDFLERGERILSVYYDQELAKNPNPYAMLDEIYCYYKRTLFFLGKIDCTEFLEDYAKFCDYSIEHDTLDHPDGFWDSRLFQVAVNHLPGILQCLNLYGEEYHGDFSLRKKCVNAYLTVIRQLPRTGNSRFVNDVITRSLYSFMELLTPEDIESDILINVMLNRDEITLIHSQMVEQIAGLLLQYMLDKKPEMLLGTFGCQTVVEVLEKRTQIAAFVSQVAKIFDLGKLKDADIVNKQSRQLTDTELRRIYMHPVAGAKIIKRIPTMKQFYDVVLGHHKSWDGTMGYPADFNNAASPDRMLIELIHISDCLDAATDFIGRSYKKQKTFEECLEEFTQGKGTLYAPNILELLTNTPELQEKMKKLLNEGRIRTYYEVYGMTMEQNTSKDVVSAAYVQEKASYEKIENYLENVQDERDQLINMLHESSQENHDFVQAMVRHSILTLYVELRSGRYHVFSKGTQQLFQTLPNGKYQDFLTHYLKNIVLPEDWEKVNYQLSMSELIHVLARNGSFECEMRVLMNKAYRWVNFRFIKMDEENVIPRTMAVTVTDVQDRHSRSNQMESVLKDAYKAATEANKAKSVFLSCMSHDIRTPMNGIMGMTQIALQHLDEKERVKDCLQKIDASSRHLMELINEVLDMSRIESGKTILHAEPVQLRELMRSVIDVCKPDSLAMKQEISTNLESLEHDWVMADSVRLRQVFTNILGNAVKYTPAGGRIEVNVYCISQNDKGEKCFQIEIRDNGIGMSEEFQKKLFEPFSREDNSMTNVKQGTGLGLSIAKSVVEMMGGRIEVESRQGIGTKFSIILQLPSAEKTKIADTYDETDTDFAHCPILLVEDNDINREIACELLGAKGLLIDVAKNGKEAVEQFAGSKNGYYKMILMDIQMPVMNGYEATRAIRKIDGAYASGIPIIALTANIFQDDIVKAMESGMNDYVTKPIDMAAIEKTLKKWISTSQ